MNRKLTLITLVALSTVARVAAVVGSDMPSFGPAVEGGRGVEAEQAAAVGAVESEEPGMKTEMLQDENNPSSTLQPSEGEMVIQTEVEKEA